MKPLRSELSRIPRLWRNSHRCRRETVQLVRQAVSEGRRAYVLVNNRSEGNAPLTVQALSEMLLK